MLTVPKGGVIAGRSADIRIEAPDTGTVIATFGDRMLASGQKIKAERDALTGQRVQLDIARDMGLARQEVDQITDPEVMGATWEQRSAEIRQRNLDKIKDPALREKLDLSFTELNDRHSLTVGNNGIALTASQRGAQWIDQRAQITSEAVDADPETLGAFLDLGNAAIDNRLASGDLDPEAAALEKQSFRNEVYSARAATAITRDPEGFLAAAGDGAYDSLGGDRLTDFRLSAEREIARRNDAAAKAAEVAAADRQKAIGSALDVVSDLAGDGLQAKDEAFLSDPEVMAHPNFAQTEAAIALRNDMPNIRQMTPAELDAAIVAEETNPKAAKYQAERVKALRAHRDKVAADLQSDPAGTALKLGLPIQPMPDFDPAKPDEFGAFISGRVTFDKWQNGKRYSNSQAIFSTADQARLKVITDPAADVGPKLALARSIAIGGGKDGAQVAKLAGGDAVFSRVVRMMGDGGDPALAAAILTGQQKVKLGTVTPPPTGTRQLLFSDVTGGAFASNPALEAEIYDTAAALYAADAAGINPDGTDSVVPFVDDTEAQDLFKNAVLRVSGAQPDRNGNLTIGGLQEINGRKVVLPRGISADVVEDTLYAVRTQIAGGTWNDNLQSFDYSDMTKDPMRGLKTASIYPGAVPAFGANIFDQWTNTQIRRVGESDVYELTRTNNGREEVVPIAGDADGRAYRFRLTDLIKGARQ